MANPFSPLWLLRPDIDFLNHGSFGATPRCVLESQQQWQARLEREPIEFLAPERTLLPKLDAVRSLVADQVNASSDDVVFVRNATDGVNAVVRSLALEPGDELIITNHGYNACNNAVRYAAERAGATVITAEIPFPILDPEQAVDAVAAALTKRSRWLLIDHVTSPTGIVLPVESITQLAHSRGVRVMVDGAHAPGMIPVDVNRIEADYYTANHHKWWCGPKASGFLFVRKPWQAEVRPGVISHGGNRDKFGRSRFQSEFNWPGTFDPSPLLALPTAIDFLSQLHPSSPRNDLSTLMNINRKLAIDARHMLLGKMQLEEPAPESMLGSLATIPVPAWNDQSAKELVAIQRSLVHDYGIEVPVFHCMPGQACLRISAQAYNSIEQYERLADALGLLDALGKLSTS